MGLSDMIQGGCGWENAEWQKNPKGHEEAIPDGRWNAFGADRDLTPVKSDAVFRPNHYARLWPEPITVVNAWNLNFNRGNALKYIARAGHKGDEIEDLRKAVRYLEIEIECIQRRKLAADPANNPKLVWSDPL